MARLKQKKSSVARTRQGPRKLGIAGIIVVLFVYVVANSMSGSPWAGTSELPAEVYASVLSDLTNKERVDAHEQPLVVNPLLVKAAQFKANDMVSKGYFAHTSPQGSTPWQWFDQAGYAYTHAGENLAIDFQNSADVVNAWILSPGHRANILDTHFTEIGIATARGTYHGQETTFVVQMFGVPQLTASTSSSSPLKVPFRRVRSPRSR